MAAVGPRRSAQAESTIDAIEQDPTKKETCTAIQDAGRSDNDLDRDIARLEDALAALRREKADRQAAAFLLTLARVVPANVCFSAVELLAHARLDRELAQAIGTLTPKRLGQYLRSLTRRPASGLTLQRCDDRNNRGCIWSITIAP